MQPSRDILSTRVSITMWTAGDGQIHVVGTEAPSSSGSERSHHEGGRPDNFLRGWVTIKALASLLIQPPLSRRGPGVTRWTTRTLNFAFKRYVAGCLHRETPPRVGSSQPGCRSHGRNSHNSVTNSSGARQARTCARSGENTLRSCCRAPRSPRLRLRIARDTVRAAPSSALSPAITRRRPEHSDDDHRAPTSVHDETSDTR
jgi:hypothetical protein